MIKFAQVLCGMFVLILGSAALTAMFFPAIINEPSGFNAGSDYGFTNLRTLGAPTLSLAIITAIGIYKKAWLLILPASMYFFFNFFARAISAVIEGYDPVMLFGLIFTFTLFMLSQIALKIFRKAN
ncbi:hypothetical protein [Pseudoalteromonas luteoviolacea]|uniref:DUF4345 domain-containing protein n=1 Tax=Pseudoalteromonas luteoviolacea H33 TaxID=1365251 RepID=A0A167E0N3_9GAMM|nr:hypothetical protein [Pseudoalteromonas luteoviolacea]KZN49847.1 hypothetical protein N476_18820 [Pseudoalteromonas luteoviolacea H33]KZN77872.1 hypothetical protein N477_01275 [Pseudoalteromonas luteoviolacea H33-S]MBQ4879424.1 hypothetical protein [Pseudoalteromonas luteoviolacea]MBQ4908484.1 hypothetical protein [Pseudoalteromonas luteoviolacea]